ncbi:putative ABC transporter [Ixodes scapularis]
MDVVPPQLSLLIWKCYVTSIKRRKLTFALEVLVPGLLALTLVYARLHVTFETVHNVTLFEHLSINRLPLRYRLPPPSASKWILYYAPNTELVNRLLDNVANDAVPQLEARGFETEEAMVAHYTAEMAHRDSVLGGIVFPDFENNATQMFVDRVRFKVRLKAAPRMKLSNSEPLQSWSTDSNFPVLQVFSPRHPKNKDDGSPGYFAEGFLYLQQEVFQEVLVHMVNQGNFNVSMPVPTTVLLQRFPLPPYTTDPFFFIIQYFLPIIVLLCFTSPSLSVIRHVSTEKESGMRDFLQMMGINPWLNYIAWFLVTLMAMTVSSVVLVFTTMTPLTGNGPVIRNSNPLVILLLFVVYSTSTINFAFLVGSLFNSANTSVAGLFTAYTASFFPFLLFFSMNNTHTTTATILACLLCNTALPLGVTMTAVLEAGNEGAQWNNIALNPNPGLGLSLFSIINMLIFDTVLYAVLVWYIEGSHMNRLVDRQPWTLFKVYNKVPVVNNVSFKAFRGQITALLGHNGAGKTTTIRMITGQLASTKGLVLIGGHNVKTQSQAAHEDMGICPQTDIHFKDMTVYEHLLFFSELKRVPSSEIEQQLCKLLSLLKMSQKRAVLARHLSGGYRRKLSIGIALVGNSKVVILDEPTAGMDPAARREIWDLLILEKANRTILLTTHAMEEADAIGDRIAIMANGVIQCCGTSFFLKKNLGAGYHMVIVKNPVCNVRTLLEVVAAFAPSAEMESNVGTELSLRISRFDQPFFKHLFSHLEDNKEKLGISSFGVSVTTLEEVFLR